jgi:hypothetical protein
MARTRRAPERDTGPALAADLLKQAAEVFATDGKTAIEVENMSPHPIVIHDVDTHAERGRLDPYAATNTRFLGPRTSIHVAIMHRGAATIVGSEDLFVCGEKPKGPRVVVAAPLDDPRFCPKCLAGRPLAHGSEIKVVTVLVSEA